MTTLPTEKCEKFFEKGIIRKNHGDLVGEIESMMIELAKVLSFDYFNQKNSFGEKIMFWIIRNNHSRIAFTLLERFGETICLDIDREGHSALEVAKKFNDNERLDSIIYLLTKH